MRQQIERWLNHENVESTLSRLSWFFESQLLFYIERIVSFMETIVFNSIQVINYWFTLHRTLRLLYQQAQISSPNIWGISDQNVTQRPFISLNSDCQCMRRMLWFSKLILWQPESGLHKLNSWNSWSNSLWRLRMIKTF